MATDKLENYILENRDLFDDQEPDPKIWNRIVEKEEKKPKIRKLNWQGVIWRAAAVIIIFVISYFVHDIINRPDITSDDDSRMAETRQNSPEIDELIEAEVYYTSMINNKKKELFQLIENDYEIKNDINYELQICPFPF